MKTVSRLWLGVAVLVVLSPLGLVVPDWLGAGSAWGEWGADEMQKLVGYVPAGMEKLSSLWNAPMPDYAFAGWEGKGLPHLGLAYVVSGVLGVGLIAALALGIGRLLARERTADAAHS